MPGTRILMSGTRQLGAPPCSPFLPLERLSLHVGVSAAPITVGAHIQIRTHMSSRSECIF